LVMGWMTFRAHMDVVTKKETQASLTWFEPNRLYKAHTKTVGSRSVEVNLTLNKQIKASTVNSIILISLKEQCICMYVAIRGTSVWKIWLIVSSRSAIALYSILSMVKQDEVPDRYWSVS
jgi:hypothetical protein